MPGREFKILRRRVETFPREKCYVFQLFIHINVALLACSVCIWRVQFQSTVLTTLICTIPFTSMQDVTITNHPHTTLYYSNPKKKTTFICSYSYMNFFFTFLKREVWRWLSRVAETCSFLGFYNMAGCLIVTQCSYVLIPLPLPQCLTRRMTWCSNGIPTFHWSLTRR